LNKAFFQGAASVSFRVSGAGLKAFRNIILLS